MVDPLSQLSTALEHAGPLVPAAIRRQVQLQRVLAGILGTMRFPLGMGGGLAAALGARFYGFLPLSMPFAVGVGMLLGLALFLGLEGARLRLIRAAVRTLATTLQGNQQLGAVGGATSAAMPSGFHAPTPTAPPQPERVVRAGDPDAEDFDDA